MYYPSYGENDPGGIGVDFRIEEGYLTPKEIWNDREKYTAEEEAFKGKWAEVNEQRKAAILTMTRNALARMHDRVEVVVPSSFDPQPGNFMDIKMRFLYSDVDEEIDRQAEVSTLATEQAASEIEEMFTAAGAMSKINVMDDDGEYFAVMSPKGRAAEMVKVYVDAGYTASIAED